MKSKDHINSLKKHNEKEQTPLTLREYIRSHPGLHIDNGKCYGDGSSYDDGIYHLIKCVMDNAIDEFVAGFGKKIDIKINYEEGKVSIRDDGRGFPPINRLAEDLSAFVHLENLNVYKYKEWIGFAILIVNAMSSWFKMQSLHEGISCRVEFSEGKLTCDSGITTADSSDSGTLIEFVPDRKIFGDYHFSKEHSEHHIWNYLALHRGLTIQYNNRTYTSNGLVDLLAHELKTEPLYPIIHITDGDFEAAFTHVNGQNAERYYSFVNGHHTPRGGTHQDAFTEGLVRVLNDFFKKDHTPEMAIREGLFCAFSIQMERPMFNSHLCNSRLISTHIGPDNMNGNDTPLLTTYMLDILQSHLTNHLRMHPDTSASLLQKIEGYGKDF